MGLSLFCGRECLSSRLGYSLLIEGNTWGDKIWGGGQVNGEGQNLLGKALMQIHEKIREETHESQKPKKQIEKEEKKMETSFKLGDVVVLKSGSPKLTVSAVMPGKGKNPTTIDVTWFNTSSDNYSSFVSERNQIAACFELAGFGS